MKIDLPEVNWINKNWTIPGQLKKIFEEAGEAAEVIAENDPKNAVKELLDTMQSCKTAITMILAVEDWELDLFLKEHIAKLERKGYLNSGSKKD